MFTRCPECETTFRLSAGDLRRAQGKVRCGECSRVFNALEYLAEDEEVEAETGKEWPIEPANDELADTIIGGAPDFSTDSAGEGADNIDATGDDEQITEAEDVFPDRWAAGSGREPVETEADDDATFEYDEFLLDEPNDDFETDENISAESSRAAPDEGPDEGPDDLPDDDRAEPLLGSIAADDDADEDDDDELILYIDADTEEIDDETAHDLSDEELSEEDEPVVFELGEEDETGESGDAGEPEGPSDSAAEDDEFDDTIWERIPGVGAIDSSPDDTGRPPADRYIAESERSFNHKGDWLSEDSKDSVSAEDAEDALVEDETAAEADSDDDPESAESMEFNASQDKWSSIFASTASWQKEEEEEPVSFTDTDGSWDATAANDEDDYVYKGKAEELESDSGPEIYSTIDELNSEADEATDVWEDDMAESNDTEATDEDVWEISADDDAGDDDDSAEWAKSIEESLAASGAVDEPISEDDSAAPTPEPEEPPAGGYDVQHIVLDDESEQADEKSQKESPSWRSESYAEQTERTTRTMRWLVGSLTMVALLSLQLVHYNRDALATNTSWGPTIRDVYARLGMELYPEWSITDYEIRGSEAVAGESGPNVMDIRAQIAAVGRAPVGLPYLRVILRDRWSNPVAAKHFSPAEYADSESLPSRLLMQPNSTIDAHVSIADPGSGAQGFELELCLPRRHTGMDCSGKPFRE
jgi:predicted Zn finger-like uncharacterized protein